MKIYTDLSEFRNVDKPVVTTGMFDGVHLGHKNILDRLKETTQKYGGETVLLTFSPHPRLVLFPDDNSLEMLNTQQEKIELLEKQGLEHLIIYPFTKEFSRLSSIEFVRDILVNKIGTKRLVIGYNHHFGRNREGSYEHLKEFGPTYGFDVEQIPAKDIDSIEISSTKIREALKSGKVAVANEYLGYDYSITGTVVKGMQLGKELGYPTANVSINDKNKLVPKDGIYTVKVEHQGQLYGGMLSIGNNPTIENKARSIEVNIFDFDKTIYDQKITISFIEWLRAEEKFNDLNELKEQLEKDKQESIRILGKK